MNEFENLNDKKKSLILISNIRKFQVSRPPTSLE